MRGNRVRKRILAVASAAGGEYGRLDKTAKKQCRNYCQYTLDCMKANG